MQASVFESAHRGSARTLPVMSAECAALTRAATDIEPALSALLHELDYGVVLLRRDGGNVVYLNQAAREMLRDGQLIAVVDSVLRTRRAIDTQPLAEALAAARRGMRRLITLGDDTSRAAVALIPMDAQIPGGSALIAAVVGRRRLCELMSVQWFARSHGLTPAETRVLELLCDGLDPSDIAALNDVSITTVRTQVNSIRDKTGTASIRALLQRLAMLPPMVSLLRS